MSTNNIQEKLSEDEIAVLETTFYPPALAESLFSDFNNMSDFDEKKFKTVRWYQYPMLSWEAFYDFENSGLDEQQKMDLRKGASDCYCIGGRLTGKCEFEENLCLLADGSYVKFKDLVGTKQNVISLNDKSFKLEKSEAHFSDNGLKDCYKVILKSGKEITITTNHPLFTDNGWKECKDLKVNEQILALDKVKVDDIINSDIYWDKIKEIKYAGKLKTVAVSVPGNKNYISNNIISHNTAIFQIVDLLLRIFYSLFSGAEEIGFSAYVFNRITKVLDKVSMGAKSHPFFKEIFKCSTARSAPYTISSTTTGFKIFGINMNCKGKTPGDSFYGEHLKVLFIEETSLETEAVYKARQHSVSEEGCIFRQSGMTNFRKTSPIGQIIKKPENRNKILNLPQKVNPTYTEAMDKDFIDEFGGKSAEGYRIFCDGDIIEDRASVFDMEFIRDNLVDEDIPIKHYEIDNDNHPMHVTILNTIKRPNNANRIFIGSDVGRGIGSTEIVIFSEINTETLPVYKYLYNITLSGLFDDELQKDIFKYLMESLNAEMLSIDIGEGSGASIYNTLIKIYPKNVYGYYGNAKIPTGHKVDENGDTLLEDNEPVPTEEFAAEFSVKRLQQLFYKCRMILPFDPKFDKQFDQVMSLYNANRVVYTCMSKNDHLFDAFRVFAIAQWIWEFKNLERPEKKELLTDFV